MNKNELSSLEKTIIIAISTIIALAILGSLTSCSQSKVYNQGNTWKPMEERSSLTGWKYQSK